MYIEDFSDCCTARIISDWQAYGTKPTVIWEGNTKWSINSYETYKEWATRQLKSLIESENEVEADNYKSSIEWGEEDGDKYPDIRNLALIFATLTSEQVWAIQFAKEVGFTSTRKVRKGRHPERTLIGLWISGKNLHKWSKNVRND